MIEGARYAHTNPIARDWRKLAAFYVEQFGCSPVPPERSFSGLDLESGTVIPGAALWCYVTDPEGNILELQSWEPPA